MNMCLGAVKSRYSFDHMGRVMLPAAARSLIVLTERLQMNPFNI